MAIYDIDLSKQDYLNQFYQTLLSLLNAGGSGGSGGSSDISTPRLNLIAMTRVRIDELMSQAEGLQFNLSKSDNSNIIDLYINALMDEAAVHLKQIAPAHILIPTEGTSLLALQALPTDPESCFGYLPQDYLRFISIRLAAWKKDITEVRTTADPKYALQSTVLKGGSAKPEVFINSAVKTNNPVAQVDSITLVGTSGKAIISGAGAIAKNIVFAGTLNATALAFVNANTAAYLAKGITLSNVNNKIIWTAVTPGVGFDHPGITTMEGDLTGETSRDTANVPAREGRKTLELYSDKTKAFTLSKFMYIDNSGAEYIQPDLHVSLAWLCASKLLQIWGQVSGNTSYAEKALAQVELSFKNRL